MVEIAKINRKAKIKKSKKEKRILKLPFETPFKNQKKRARTQRRIKTPCLGKSKTLLKPKKNKGSKKTKK